MNFSTICRLLSSTVWCKRTLLPFVLKNTTYQMRAWTSNKQADIAGNAVKCFGHRFRKILKSFRHMWRRTVKSLGECSDGTLEDRRKGGWKGKVMPRYGIAMKVGKLSALWDSTSSRCFVGKVPPTPTCLVCGDARKCAIDFYPRKVGFRERLRKAGWEVEEYRDR